MGAGSVIVGNVGINVDGIGDPSIIIELAGQMTRGAEQAAANLINANFSAPVINAIFPSIAAAPVLQTQGAPTVQPITWSMPAAPTTYQGSISVPSMPMLTALQPALILPPAPASFNGVAPAAPGVDTNFVLPTLSVNLPAAPALMQLDTVVFDGVTIPTFNLNAPTLTAVAPSPITYVEGAQFTSQLLTDTLTILDARITSGTNTGLPAAIENAIWDQAREQVYRQQADALAELERYEELGYALPPGVYNDDRIKLQTEMQNTVQGLARDISIEQAKLVQDNIKASLEQAVVLEGKLIDYQNQIAQRAFEAAKYMTEAMISAFNAQVEAFKGNIEGFKAQIAAYDALIRGLEMQVQVYKTEVDAEMVKAEINKTLVDEYKVKVDAALSAVEIYKAEIGGVEAQAQIQKLVVDTYAAQIQGYVANINAYTAGVEGYKASVQAQGVVQEAYKTTVDAFSAQVGAVAKEIDANVEVFKGNIEAKQLEAEVFKAIVSGQAEQARAIASSNQSAAEVFKAVVQGEASYNEVLTKQWEAVINENEHVAQIGVTAAKANGDLYIAARGLSLDASKTAAQVYSQLGAAALNAIHFSTSGSASGSASAANSQSQSTVNETIQSATV